MRRPSAQRLEHAEAIVGQEKLNVTRVGACHQSAALHLCLTSTANLSATAINATPLQSWANNSSWRVWKEKSRLLLLEQF